jgi:N4-gp56 family major capsid protein
MADTIIPAGLRAQIWDSKFFTEYLSENRFSESMGSDENAVIQVREDLSKGKGDSVTIAMVNKLANPAVLGSNMLEGNEEDMSSRSQRIFIDKRRNAVRIAEMEEYKSAIDLRDAARATLKDWSMKDTERLIVDALLSVDGIRYEDASAAQRDAWLNNNIDRVLFGQAISNSGTAGSATYAAALNQIDNTNDKLTPAAISLMKELALTCNPKITPVRVEKTKGRRYYVLYVNTRAMRDLKTNASMMQAQREVSLEVENNRLFEGGDLLWDGVIVKEVPEILFYSSSIVVSPVFFCGAQAVATVYGKRWRTMTKEFDYGDKYGIGIECIMGVRKMQFGTGATDLATLRDNGVVTGWFAAVPSA